MNWNQYLLNTISSLEVRGSVVLPQVLSALSAVLEEEGNLREAVILDRFAKENEKELENVTSSASPYWTSGV